MVPSSTFTLIDIVGITQDIKRTLTFLRQQRVIASTMKCDTDKCPNTETKLNTILKSEDGEVWKCFKCKGTTSIRK